MSMSSGQPYIDSPTENLTLSDPRCNNDSCKAFYNAHQLSQKLTSYAHQYDYGHYISWYLVVCLGVFAVVHFGRQWNEYRRLSGSSAVHTSPLQTARSKALALWRTMAYRRAPGWISTRFGLPSYGMLTFLLLNVLTFLLLNVLTFLLLNVLYCCILTFAVRPYYRNHRGYGSPPLAVRAGLMATALTPWLIALTSKANIVTWLTGIGHEKLNIIHRWMGWLCFGLSVVHTVPFIVAPLRDGGYAALHKQFYKPGGYEYTGTPLLGILFGLLVFSLPWVRHRFYEGFYHLHFWLAVTYVGLMFWHCNDQPDTWIYMWASVAAWLLSIFARLFWYNRATNIMSAEWMMLSPISMTSFSDNMTRLRISAPATFHWKPGQHVYLRVPKLNIFDNHPFTIANDHRAGRIGAEYTELDLFIRSHAGFTRRLERYVSNNPDRELNGWLDGPYGSHHSNVGVTFDSVILIAGGGGVSAVLPWLDHLVTRMKNQQSTRTASIKVLWSIRHSGSLHWIRDILEDVDLKGLGDRVKIIVHITGEEQSEPAAAKAMEVEPKSQATDQSRSRGLTCASLDLEYGRIRWTDIFDDILPKSRTIVISCGPESLKVDISNACAKAQRLVMKGQLAEVELWTETFGW